MIAVPGDAAGLVDTCGTGGGALTTFNISTAAALLAAGAGVRVAKHGNRSFTSRCGSADVLEALGVKIEAPPATLERALREAGICFMFAPQMHPAMRHVGPVRRELGIPTVMNIVGPLANPAMAGRQVVGVADERRVPAAPDVATLGEQNAAIDVDLWFGMLAPAGTPRDIVERYNTMTNEILSTPAVREKLAKQGLTVIGGPPEKFADLITKDLAKWSKAIKDAGITAE